MVTKNKHKKRSSYNKQAKNRPGRRRIPSNGNRTGSSETNNKDLLQEALKLHQSGNLTEAAHLYHKILEKDPGHVDANFLLGTLNLQQGNLDNATMHLKKTIALKPDHVTAHNNLGTVLQAHGKLAEAVASFNKVIELQPDYAVAHYNLGNALRKDSKLDEAVRSYRQSITLNPNDAEVYYNLGNVLKEQGKLDEAVENYRQAIKLKPDYAMTYCNLGTLLQEQGKLDEATANYNRAIEINPDYAEAYYNIGSVLQEQNKLDKAVLSYNKAIALKPDHVKAHNNLGAVLQEQGKLDEAVSSYNKAIALKPDYADAYNNLGTLLKEQARFDEAIPHYKHTLRINPEHVDALGNLADTWERKNNLDDAQLYVEKGLGLAPGNPFLNLIAAKLERRQDRNQDAIDRLEKIEHTGRFGAKIQYLLGQLKDKTGNTHEAFEHFMAGNRLESEKFSCRNVNKDTYLQGINNLEEYFKQDVFDTWTTSPVSEAEEHPVFLIGFPRSGTTLLDQILDSHPGIQTLEEKPIIPTLVSVINKLPKGFPDTLSNITQDHISQLRTHYSQIVSKHIHRQDGTLLIDKLPLNIPLIPLIWRIFPQAKIILSLRHPCDACLSCFMQHFQANEAMANFLTLEDTANLYSKVMGLWKRYEEIFPLDHHIIKYEDLVVDFESETRKILDFLGVEWDDKILKYNNHARKRDLITTPSYHQVTRPIYQNAKYRWQKYTDQLDPIMETLKPFIEYFGYCTSESKNNLHMKPLCSVTRARR